MDLLFAAASATFDGTPQPLTTGLSLMARYSQGSFSKPREEQQERPAEVQDDVISPPPSSNAKPHEVAESAVVEERCVEEDEPAIPIHNEPHADVQATSSPQVQEPPASSTAEVQQSQQLVSPERHNEQEQPKSGPEEPSTTITPDTVIGIRHPRNDQRRVFDSTKSTTEKQNGARGRCSDVYRQLCDVYEVHTNSRVMRILEQHEDNTQIPQNPFEDLTSLDLSLCMLRDKGMLPIVEMLRLCVNLKYLGLASNDISNNGIEYLAHAVVEGTVGSSFEVMDEDNAASSSYCVENRIEKAGTTMISTTNRFGLNIESLDMSDNLISLGGMRLIQLIAEKLPSLIDVKVGGARVDACEFSELETILEENRLYCG
ncbi:Hypothetical protein, putative [Bodo saltans]|uniref:Leucine-rich repeat protein n=1 Tax=Bodo saltans TaxID=75058 RepID=A0A0S4J8G9_BODSA|nr:Hypothetical protein, putative [Bodo saltans]|eukprot:CUG82150.1 Hypothetical protein, putative [Bodo saltans]